MKKTLLVLLLLAISAPVFAEIIFTPEWKEFCPPQYADISIDKDYKLDEKKYWANRKATFEKRIAQCESLNAKEKSACFAEVRKMELSANNTKNEFKSVQLQEKSVKSQFMPKSNYIYHTFN